MKFSVHVIRAVAWSFYDNGIRYVLPVLWMTSCFPIIDPVACSIGSIDVGAVMKQVVINFKRIRQVAPHC